MQDSEVTQTRGKLFPRPRPELVIEKVTQMKASYDPYRNGCTKLNGQSAGARMVPVSLPRVKWLERPDV
jgi:hypothetical protein